VVTPGQQAPTGVTLSPARRRALLQWAGESGAWIVEDDYLGELQLSGRAAPALAAEDCHGRVIHIGSFGKTLSAALGLGFLVAPLALAERFGEVAACLQPAPNTTTQAALTSFIADGHYLRHLRQMKRLYARRRDLLRAALRDTLGIDLEVAAGLAVILSLPPGTDDVALARKALEGGIAPMALSVWWNDPTSAPRGLMLSVTNVRSAHIEKECALLKNVIAA
jgi:GntR family transcriptional regulator/MocR family aminotransferase